MSVKISTRGIKRLEVAMRDVLDGLEDAATYMNYQSVPDIVEILSIEPPGREIQPRNSVVPLINKNSADSSKSENIVDYLIKRELKISA